ncbi:MAG: YraN family protein [Vampirovibrio sp.]
MKEKSINSYKTRWGLWGERVVKTYLLERGWHFVAERFRVHQQGEVDLIFKEGETLVFIEVKTRQKSTLETGYDALTPRKKKAFLTTIEGFLHQTELSYQAVRVDWVVVQWHAPDSSEGAYATLDHRQHIELY